jgi:hypothetical protein
MHFRVHVSDPFWHNGIRWAAILRSQAKPGIKGGTVFAARTGKDFI